MKRGLWEEILKFENFFQTSPPSDYAIDRPLFGRLETPERIDVHKIIHYESIFGQRTDRIQVAQVCLKCREIVISDGEYFQHALTLSESYKDFSGTELAVRLKTPHPE